MVRKPGDAEKLKAFGFATVIGSLDQEEILKDSLYRADAVIHTADSDDPAVSERFIKLLRGTGKTFIYTSGSSSRVPLPIICQNLV